MVTHLVPDAVTLQQGHRSSGKWPPHVRSRMEYQIGLSVFTALKDLHRALCSGMLFKIWVPSLEQLQATDTSRGCSFGSSKLGQIVSPSCPSLPLSDLAMWPAQSTVSLMVCNLQCAQDAACCVSGAPCLTHGAYVVAHVAARMLFFSRITPAQRHARYDSCATTS